MCRDHLCRGDYGPARPDDGGLHRLYRNERGIGLGLYYLGTTLAQVALVPVNDLSISVMVLLNGTLSLFFLRKLFGLTRGQAVVAQVMQLGFGAGVFAMLELVTSLLTTIGVAA